jgi:predicted phosphodiesterase
VLLSKDNILVWSCSHIPFEHKLFLEFLKEKQRKEKCGKVICLGDLVDNHALSMHFDQDPNGLSPSYEIKEARQRLKQWFKAFPELLLSLGNHDERVDLKAKHVGLPRDVFRPFRDIWGLPNGWKDAFTHEVGGVRYIHGTGFSGDQAPEKAAIMNRQSCVIGHIHHNLKSGYMTSHRDRILYMGVGCGIDIKKYAFAYGKDFTKRPVLGCGVVKNNGVNCQVYPMEL